MRWHPIEIENESQNLGLLYAKFSVGAVVSLKWKKTKRIAYVNILFIVSGDWVSVDVV